MRKNIVSILGGLFCTGVLFITSCTKMDHFYKDYVIERTYTGKPDSIWIQPGDGRIQIGMLTPKDPAAKNIVVRWNQTDSIVMAIDHDATQNFIVIDNLEERDYIFNAYTVNDLGARSLPMELSTNVYGDNFRNTMRERAFTHSVVLGDSIAVIWAPSTLLPEIVLGNEIKFTDKNGAPQQVFEPRSKVITILHEVDPTKPITVRTVNRPHSNAFENFYTAALDLDLVETKRNTLTFSSTSYTDAVYVDFHYLRTFLEAGLPTPLGADIDVAYALGAGSRGNLFAMDGTGFGSFASAWQTFIDTWPVQNVGRMKLVKNAGAQYDVLDETDRGQMMAAYTSSTATASTRLQSLAVNDLVLMHVVDKDLYVAMKVIATPPPVSGALGDLVIEVKVSRP